MPLGALQRREVAEAHLLLPTTNRSIVTLEEGDKLLDEALSPIVDDRGDLLQLEVKYVEYAG